MKRNGFTLIEMVITIVVTSIIFLGISSFIQLGATGYTNTIDRQKIQNEARFVLEKMTREIRHAVPNSFELVNGNQCIQFYPILFSGFYHWDEVNNQIQFIVGDQTTNSFSTRDRMVINPSRIEDLATSSTQSIDLKGSNVSYESDGYFEISSPTIAWHSIANRHYIYNTDQLTRYCVNNNIVTRQTPSVSGSQPVVVAQQIDSSNSLFQYEHVSLQRGGLIHIELAFTQMINGSAETSNYIHDVQVMNVQ